MISKNLKKRFSTSILLLTLLLLIYKFKFALVFSLLVFGVLSILEFMKTINKIYINKIWKFIINFIFIIYIFLFSYFLIFFTSFFQLKVLIFIILAGCIASDLGGYIFGKLIQGPKLTKISPKKTLSGSIGSIALTLITVSSLIFFATGETFFNFKILIICIIISISSQMGDLLFSFLKRKAKIQDYANYLPGHGGVLDRLDGVLLGLPVGFVIFIIIY